MAKVSQPELKRFLDKKVAVNIQGGRQIRGTLRGFDIYLNLVVDDAVEMVRPGGEGGTGVAGHRWTEGSSCGGTVVVRGNSVHSLEGLDAIRTR